MTTALTLELNLSQSEEEILADQIDRASTSAVNLKTAIGEIYVLMLGDRVSQRGTFKQICEDNDCWGYSLAHCYKLGESYQQRMRVRMMFASGDLDIPDPRKLPDVVFQELGRVDPEYHQEVLEAACSDFVSKNGKVTQQSMEDAIAHVGQKYEDPIAKPKLKRSSSGGSGMSKTELEAQTQLQEQGELLRQLKEQMLEFQARLNQAESKAETAEQALRQEIQAKEEILSEKERLEQERNRLARENEELKAKLEQQIRVEAPIESIPVIERIESNDRVVGIPDKPAIGSQVRYNNTIWNVVGFEQGNIWEYALIQLPSSKDAPIRAMAHQCFPVEISDDGELDF